MLTVFVTFIQNCLHSNVVFLNYLSMQENKFVTPDTFKRGKLQSFYEVQKPWKGGVEKIAFSESIGTGSSCTFCF